MGVATAFVLSCSITGPLYELTAGATAISRGDHSRTVKINRRDEIGQLATAFNAMVEKLRESQRELERKVQDRTAQLEEANRRLELLSESHAEKRSVAEREREDALEALHNTEKQLVQSQKLEAVGRLAGGILDTPTSRNEACRKAILYSAISTRSRRRANVRRRLRDSYWHSVASKSCNRKCLT
jgi:nitrate/nitrite-specific signal transduction histidine kinase